MTRAPLRPDDPIGPYDGKTGADEDLWFLPATSDEDEPWSSGPRTAPRPVLFDPALWRAAQNSLSDLLADLALAYGALDERLRTAPPGWRNRLALLEVADLGWWTGDRLGVERLALWLGARIGATGEDAQALARAGWAVRRLTGGPAPSDGGWGAGTPGFLGRTSAEVRAYEVPDTILDLAEVMERAAGLHPFTQGAMLFHTWRMLGTSPAQDIEAAIMAGRHAASAGRGGAIFLPLALSGPTALRATGSEEVRLGAWFRGAHQAVLAARLHLDRVADWRDRARRQTTDLSGRTPPVLLDTLAAWPMVSAPLAESETGASRAAVQRNLDRLVARGLIREVTGQGRYRVWAAAF